MSAIHKIKHKVQLSALLASRQCAECFILCIATARPCIATARLCFKESTLTLSYSLPVSSITHLSSLSSRVRRFWTISYANTSVSRLILVKLTWLRHLVSLFTIHFLHLTMLYCNIALQMRFRCYTANIALIFALILLRKVLNIWLKHFLW